MIETILNTVLVILIILVVVLVGLEIRKHMLIKIVTKQIIGQYQYIHMYKKEDVDRFTKILEEVEDIVSPRVIYTARELLKVREAMLKLEEKNNAKP